MKQKNFLKTVLLLCAIIVGSTSAWAETITKWVKTDATSLVTGDVVVIVDQTTAYAMPNDKGTNSAPNVTSVTLNTAKTEITSAVAANLQWDITIGTNSSNERTYQFSVTSNETTSYLFVKNTNNGVRVSSSSSDYNGLNTLKFVSDANSTQSTAGFLVEPTNTRYVGQYNNSDWRCYTSIHNNIKATVTAFYKKVVEESSATSVTLSFPSNTYSATMGETFTAPTLTVDPSGYDGTIGYSSSNENVATVAADGTVTLVGAGETTITASAPATTNYLAAETNYTLKVKGAIVDGVFDFTNTQDYGSNIELGTTYKESKVFTAGNITLTADGNFCWYAGEPNTLRIYKDGTAVIAAPSGYNITKIEVTGADLTKGTIDGDAFTDDTEDEWTGEAQSVTIARNTATIQLKTITVTYEQAVEKAEAGLSFGATTTFNVNVGEGDAFEAPSLTTATGFDGTVTYDYESTNDANTVVLDSSTGDILIEANAEGTITVTASSEATSNFKAGSAYYTINIVDSRTEAGLAWSENKVDIELNASVGDYTLPTLTNPNSVTVTYSSSDEDVAVVDDTTGEVIVDTSAEGTATITATFDGNSTYKPATISYTINILDPNVRDGSETNPYNVADVIAFYNNNNEKKANVYVKGYIIGACNSSTGSLLTNINTNANIALSDSPTDKDNYCILQLPQGDVRTALNAQDKPYNVGVAQVLVKGNIEKYCGKAGVKSPSEGLKVAEKVSITAAGMATYYTDCALDFTDFTDIYVYTATVSDNAITFNRVRKVPANTGVLLRNPNGKVATSRLVSVTETPENVTSVLEGTLEDIDALASVDGNYVNYILNNGSQGVGFYKANGQSLDAHKAYLHVSSQAAARSFIGFSEDETTGISNVNSETIANGRFYNLAGQNVANPTKGLYIVNGKKVILK